MIDILKNIMHITNPDYLSASVAESLHGLPLHLHCKDKKGRYIDFNEQVLIDCGLSKFTDLRGLSDLDFAFLKKGEALNIRHRDMEVIAKDISNINIGPLTLYNNATAQEISIKNPLKSKFTKKIIGVMTCAFVFPERSPFHKEFFRKNNKMNSIDSTNPNIFNEAYRKLSNREKQCLELYLSGESGRGTALILGLSHRTVDDYINNIKKKLKCKRKRDLLKLFMAF